MHIPSRLIYLDTNVYNHFADQLSASEVESLPAALERLDVHVVISPTNVLEILSLGETERKEELVWVAQHIAAPPILPEVESIIIDYAARMLNDPRVEHLRLRRPTARPDLSREWTRVYNEKGRTLGISEENIMSLNVMKELSALFHSVISRGRFGVEEWSFDLRNVAPTDFRCAIRDYTAQTRQQPLPLVRSAFFLDTVAILAATLLCVGLTPYPEPIDEF
jgi:hypothetical protein